MACVAPTGNHVNICPLPQVGAGATQAHTVITIVLGITGAIALLVIVVAGLRYTLSRGNPQATGQAKAAIIYALVGLVITMAAFAVVNFVVVST